MKNINKILLTGFIVGCSVASIFAMKIDEVKGTQAHETAAASAAAKAPSATDVHVLMPIAGNLGYLSTLPDELIVKILVHSIEEINLAILELKRLRLVNKTFKNFLSDQEIAKILGFKNLENIVIYANQINPDKGETLLHKAIRTRKFALAKFLIEAGVNINAPTISPRDPKLLKRFPVGTTSLHMAVRKGPPQLVRLLIERGADVTAVCHSDYPRENNITALDYAIRANRQDIIAILAEGYKAMGLTMPAATAVAHPHVPRPLNFDRTEDENNAGDGNFAIPPAPKRHEPSAQ